MRRPPIRVQALLLVAACACGLSGCASSSRPGTPDAPAGIRVTSPAFPAGGRVPVRFTCDGAQISPPLAWRGVPHRARALALVVDDPDAPGGTFIHWVVLDIPVSVHGVGAGHVPRGGVQARSSAGHAAYTGPCPPGGTHHYRFTVYALSARTGLRQGAATGAALTAIAHAAVAQGRLGATYRR
ncbi:MAG: YbhB/YbcL family Raf kinase inhibitor-like protein [Nocardioidaceae bacterium]